MPTARQSLIENILVRAASGQAICFTPTVGLRNAVDNAGFTRVVSADGKDEIRGDQAQFVAQAIESAVLGQPQLLQAIYTAERDRAISRYQGASTTATSTKNAADAAAAALNGSVLS